MRLFKIHERELFFEHFVNLYTANVGRMTNNNSVISTNAYDPK